MDHPKIMQYPVVFVVALSCEAKPLIEYYRLKRNHGIKSFKVFDAKGIWLIVSGVGKVAAATAVGFMAGRLRDEAEKTVWLNVGIARHPLLNIGELRWVNKAIDQSTGRTLYPSICVRTAALSATCVTVDRCSEHVEEDALFDMEVSGFMLAASRYTTQELVHSLKVVSDNQQQSPEGITAKEVVLLIAAVIAEIATFLKKLALLRDDYWQKQDIGQDLFVDILSLHRFSQTTKIQLHKQIKKIFSLERQPQINIKEIALLKSRKEALVYLQNIVDQSLVNGPA